MDLIEDFLEPGVYWVTWINEATGRIYVTHKVSDANGHPLVLVGDDGTMYNWNTVLSIKAV